MKITRLLTDGAVLAEIGRRISKRRVELNMTQAEAAREAGVAKRTLERVEAGASAQTLSFVRILRALDLIADLDGLIPEPVPRPMDLLRQKRKLRLRASKKQDDRVQDGNSWRWKEDE